MHAVVCKGTFQPIYETILFVRRYV